MVAGGLPDKLDVVDALITLRPLALGDPDRAYWADQIVQRRTVDVNRLLQHGEASLPLL